LIRGVRCNCENENEKETIKSSHAVGLKIKRALSKNEGRARRLKRRSPKYLRHPLGFAQGKLLTFLFLPPYFD
jgi:hypothetical protein